MFIGGVCWLGGHGKVDGKLRGLQQEVRVTTERLRGLKPVYLVVVLHVLAIKGVIVNLEILNYLRTCCLEVLALFSSSPVNGFALILIPRPLICP